MLQPYHERQPSYRAQQWHPGIKIDDACNVQSVNGSLYIAGRLRAIQPGDWIVVDSEDYVMLMNDRDFRARFVVPEKPSPHVGQVAGMMIGVPTPDAEPPSSLTSDQRQEVERIVEEMLLARFGPW